jgi:hypothetical protein
MNVCAASSHLQGCFRQGQALDVNKRDVKGSNITPSPTSFLLLEQKHIV